MYFNSQHISYISHKSFDKYLSSVAYAGKAPMRSAPIVEKFRPEILNLWLFPSAHLLSDQSILQSTEALIACITLQAAVLLSPSYKNF